MSRPFKLTPPQASEDDIEAGCMTILALHNYWVIRLHAGVFQTLDGKRHIHGVKKGTPDYACLHREHRCFLLEVKRPGGKLMPEQEAQIAYLAHFFGVETVVVDDVDDLSAFLAQHERSP